MLYREIIAVCSQIHIKHTNTLNVTDDAVNLQTTNHTNVYCGLLTSVPIQKQTDWFRLCLRIIQVTIRSNALPPPSRYKYWHVCEFGCEFYMLSLCLAMYLVTQQYGQSGLLHRQQYPPGSRDTPPPPPPKTEHRSIIGLTGVVEGAYPSLVKGFVFQACKSLFL